MGKKEDQSVFINRYNSIDIDFSDRSFSQMFQLVIDIVNHYLNKSRPGILLGLVELGYDRGSFVGGFHKVGTNEIYLNKSALRVMREESPMEDYKAYLFHLLLHEYLHSTGVTDEQKTRQLTRALSLELFDTRHPAGRLVVQGLNALFPYSFHNERYQPHPREMLNPEFVLLRHRDSEFTYI
ncbi:MAG: hypothetical protein JSV04_14150 [Candidatus Heimdallarchaeota archaeon]|nr:MAG: hypothetical protein JSV04_14150 [Candidatus Heimdallarchaeota archaeon]